jgi:hypothetical protein
MKPLVAFKILTLERIVEMGGSPIVKITLKDESIVEGYFDGILFEKGQMKLNICTYAGSAPGVGVYNIKELCVLEQDSDHVTKENESEMIEKVNKFNDDIRDYINGRVGTSGIS